MKPDKGGTMNSHKADNHRFTIPLLTGTILLSTFMGACSKDERHFAPAVRAKDSVPMMTDYGVSTLISDSGRIRYKIVTEEWKIYPTTKPSKWTFEKGLFLEKFNQDFHVEAWVQADTAYYYDQQKLWRLIGHVFVRNLKDETFRTHELFWDQANHEIYSHTYMIVDTPNQHLEGTSFRSNESMTQYEVFNSEGHFPMKGGQSTPGDSVKRAFIKPE